jgi:hypothetical protein
MTSRVLIASWGTVIGCFGAGQALAAKPIREEAIRVIRADAVADASSTVDAVPLAAPIERAQMHRLSNLGNVAGTTPPGTAVYSNTSATPSAYAPGINDRIADDATLAGGACDMVYVNVAVYNTQTSGTYNAAVELWNGNPCLPGSAVIPDTLATFSNIPAMYPDQSHASLLDATADPSIPLPSTVWIAVTFTGPRASTASWLVAGQAEIGTTSNTFSEL